MLSEPQIAGPYLSDLVGEPQPVKLDRGVPARRQHHSRRARQNRQQTLELCQRLSRSQLVEIVDDQHDAFEQVGVIQLRTDHVDQLVAVNPGYRRGWHLGIDRRCRAAERIQDRSPEPLRILLVAVDGYERDATNVGRAVGPRTQQRGLPTSRRRRDDGDPPGHGEIQRLEERFPVQQAPGDRYVS